MSALNFNTTLSHANQKINCSLRGTLWNAAALTTGTASIPFQMMGALFQELVDGKLPLILAFLSPGLIPVGAVSKVVALGLTKTSSYSLDNAAQHFRCNSREFFASWLVP